MTTSARSTFGTKLYRGGSGTPRTGGTLIEQLTNIEFNEQSVEMLDATSHDSAAGESIPAGITDNGEISVTLNYYAATGQELVRGDLGAAAGGYYINLPGGSGRPQFYFTAIVRSWRPQAAPVRGVQQIAAVLRITGAFTQTTQ